MPVSKFLFNCQRKGVCCKNRKNIEVFIDDVERWWKEGKFAKIFPYLKIQMKEEFPMQMEIKKDDACPFLKKNDCTIYDFRPVSCRAFPLGFNGKNFTLTTEDCKGVGKGKMTKESLEEIRIAADLGYHAKVRTIAILPALQAIILKEAMNKSEEAVSKLSSEDKEKLKTIFEEKK